MAEKFVLANCLNPDVVRLRFEPPLGKTPEFFKNSGVWGAPWCQVTNSGKAYADVASGLETKLLKRLKRLSVTVYKFRCERRDTLPPKPAETVPGKGSPKHLVFRAEGV